MTPGALEGTCCFVRIGDLVGDRAGVFVGVIGFVGVFVGVRVIVTAASPLRGGAAVGVSGVSGRGPLRRA